MATIASFQKFTASNSAAVVSAGTPVIVYALNVASDGTGGEIDLCSGIDDTTTVIVTFAGANLGTIISFPEGILFPDGCYVSLDSHITQATVVYQKL